MENKDLVPSNIDGKNMTEDFLEEIADNGKVLRSGGNGYGKILFYFDKFPFEAIWTKGRNTMTIKGFYNREFWIDNIVRELNLLFENTEDTFLKIRFSKTSPRTIVLDFWKK